MDHFNYQHGELFAEDVPVSMIAKEVGTPCYVYSRATFERHWHAFDKSLGRHPHDICYAVKANSNLAILNILARLGSGFDIVSGGELARVLAARGKPEKIIFSGVGKLRHEVIAAINANIGCFNVESVAELQMINDIAREQRCVAPIALRINPDVDADTHPYISTGLKENKFGIAMHKVMDIYQGMQELSNIKIKGVACHIGSQLTSTEPFIAALKELLQFSDHLEAANIQLEHIDIGGGLGVKYKDEKPPLPDEYANEIRDVLADREIKVILEPGRAIAANAGILVTQVQLLKHNLHKNFAIVDAAMNDLMRPALYQAWHDIIPIVPAWKQEERIYDVVGPVCETGDFLGKDRALSIKARDLLAIRSAGAYSFTMSSNYNTRPRATEVMVDGNQYQVIRPRETVQQLFSTETLLP